jgi:hypothetical protein
LSAIDRYLSYKLLKCFSFLLNTKNLINFSKIIDPMKFLIWNLLIICYHIIYLTNSEYSFFFQFIYHHSCHVDSLFKTYHSIFQHFYPYEWSLNEYLLIWKKMISTEIVFFTWLLKYLIYLSRSCLKITSENVIWNIKTVNYKFSLTFYWK